MYLPSRGSYCLIWTSSTQSAGNHPVLPLTLPSQNPPSPIDRTVDPQHTECYSITTPTGTAVSTVHRATVWPLTLSPRCSWISPVPWGTWDRVAMKVRPGTALYSLLFLIWGVRGGEEGGLVSTWPPPLGLQTDKSTNDSVIKLTRAVSNDWFLTSYNNTVNKYTVMTKTTKTKV